MRIAPTRVQFTHFPGECLKPKTRWRSEVNSNSRYRFLNIGRQHSKEIFRSCAMNNIATGQAVRTRSYKRGATARGNHTNGSPFRSLSLTRLLVTSGCAPGRASTHRSPLILRDFNSRRLVGSVYTNATSTLCLHNCSPATTELLGRAPVARPATGAKVAQNGRQFPAVGEERGN
jgi:hypothetical protein